MADGIVHARVASAGVVVLSAGAAAVLVAGEPVAAAGIVSGAFSGLLITPDIDHHARTFEETRIYRRVGPIAGRLWQAFWAPYAVVFKHRGVSHWPLIGTLTRLLYVLVPLVAALALAGVDVAALAQVPAVQTFMAWMYAAWAAQDMLHLLWDIG